MTDPTEGRWWVMTLRRAALWLTVLVFVALLVAIVVTQPPAPPINR